MAATGEWREGLERAGTADRPGVVVRKLKSEYVLLTPDTDKWKGWVQI